MIDDFRIKHTYTYSGTHNSNGYSGQFEIIRWECGTAEATWNIP